jgi:type II secretory pathway pseudopilin PulG
MTQMPERWHKERGASLLVVLVLLLIMGLSAGIAGSTWQSIVQRARETELLWRGDQYRMAIRSYSEQGGRVGQFPARLEDLLKDPRSLTVKKHIRQLYPDPMTGSDWVPVKDPGGRIIGVRSSSALMPFKQDGFSDDYLSFNGASSYSAWEFIWRPKVTQKSLKKPFLKPVSGASP